MVEKGGGVIKLHRTTPELFLQNNKVNDKLLVIQHLNLPCKILFIPPMWQRAVQKS